MTLKSYSLEFMNFANDFFTFRSLDPTTSTPDQFWKYQEWHELDGYPYWATHATYSGGGYEAQFGK